MAGELALETTPIPGLVVLRLDVREDARGWFKENWQREKMVALGLPDFGPVQNNISFNAERGATRGIHTEPWDKFVSVANGRAFAAWVDMREGETFGTTFHIELDPATAVFVPRGVGNSYQTLDDGVAYVYLVNEHYRPGVAYPALNLADPTAAIPWPIPLAESEISEKDRTNPPPRRGHADATQEDADHRRRRASSAGPSQAVFPDADLVDLDELDLTDPAAVAAWPWHDYAVVLNAAAYTAVDAAETPEGRVACWAANASVPVGAGEDRRRAPPDAGALLLRLRLRRHRRASTPRTSRSRRSGVYAQAKAAGDIAVSTATPPLRAAHLVGDRRRQQLRAHHAVPGREGRLPHRRRRPGRPAHVHRRAGPGHRPPARLAAAYGTYNVSNGGPAMSWADIAGAVFERSGRSAADVTPCTTEEYAAGKDMAPRPANSVLSLAKIEATGFTPTDAMTALDAYLA